MLTIYWSDGKMQAACDWWLVDDDGRWEPKGQHVFINQLEVNRGVNLHRVRCYLVEVISQLVPWTTGVYWERKHDGVKREHAFRRDQLQQLRGANGSR